MMKHVRERASLQQAKMLQLERDRSTVKELRQELESRLSSAEEEAEAIVSRAQNQADVERAALLQEAQGEVERILTEAQMDAYRMKRQAIDEFHDELLDAVLDVSGLVIGRVAPDDLQEAMVQQLCDSVWELGQSDMRRVDVLRRSLGERTPTVVARTAQTLSPEQQGLVVRTFSALADRNVNLDLKVEPTLGLGMQVRLGDLVMDNTVAGRLEELQESVSDALSEQIANE
jgi:F0F1-type ATP synthase membrane subunit b/b'